MIHTIDIKIRGYHLDVFGHVNNARYLEFLEEARWAAFERTVDLEALAHDGFVFTVVNINISYRRPALMNDLLSIETRNSKWGKRSGVLRQEVRNRENGDLVADAVVTFVMLDKETQKAAFMDDGLREKLKVG